MRRIPFPERTWQDFTDPLLKLIKVARIMNSAQGPVELDLAKSRFLSPLLIAGSAALVRAHQEKGIGSKAPAHSEDPGLRAYLELVHFPQGLDQTDSTFGAMRHLAAFRQKTYVPLISFPASQGDAKRREDLLQAVEDLMVHQCGLSGQLLIAVKYLIAELVGNISYHAAHGTGFLFAQYMPNGHYLDLAIVDTGQGLSGSYRQSSRYPPPASDAGALRMALQGKSTKDEAVSRGYGISTSRRMLVDGLGGSFFYWSGSAFLLNNPSQERIYQFDTDAGFPGCYIAMRIPTVANANFSVMQFVE